MHNIETYTDGSGSFISARVPGWHHLGTVKEGGYLDLDEMFSGSRADFPAYKIPIQGIMLTENGVSIVQDPNQVMVVRQHPEQPNEFIKLGIVGTDYSLIQYRDAFSFGAAILDTHEAVGETAGVLGVGERAFCCFRIPAETVMVGGIDPVLSYLVIYTGHDGGTALEAIKTNIRVVCQNTVNMARKTKTKWRLRHTKNASLSNVDQARELLGLSALAQQEFAAAAEVLINKKVTKDQFDKIIEQEFGTKKKDDPRSMGRWQEKRDRLMWLFTKADTVANIAGTAWGALQAVTEYNDYYTPLHRADDDDAAGRRFARSVFGDTSMFGDTYINVEKAMHRALLAL